MDRGIDGANPIYNSPNIYVKTLFDCYGGIYLLKGNHLFFISRG